MNKEKILRNLNKYDYNFIINNDVIIVKLDFSHHVMIDISDDNKIKIQDKLVHWNFLTGGISMNLKNAMVYNFVATILFAILCLYSNHKQSVLNLTDLFLAYGIWIVLFTGFYNMKYESFKNQVIYWTNVN